MKNPDPPGADLRDHYFAKLSDENKAELLKMAIGKKVRLSPGALIGNSPQYLLDVGTEYAFLTLTRQAQGGSVGGETVLRKIDLADIDDVFIEEAKRYTIYEWEDKCSQD